MFKTSYFGSVGIVFRFQEWKMRRKFDNMPVKVLESELHKRYQEIEDLTSYMNISYKKSKRVKRRLQKLEFEILVILNLIQEILKVGEDIE